MYFYIAINVKLMYNKKKNEYSDTVPIAYRHTQTVEKVVLPQVNNL